MTHMRAYAVRAIQSLTKYTAGIHIRATPARPAVMLIPIISVPATVTAPISLLRFSGKLRFSSGSFSENKVKEYVTAVHITGNKLKMYGVFYVFVF